MVLKVYLPKYIYVDDITNFDMNFLEFSLSEGGGVGGEGTYTSYNYYIHGNKLKVGLQLYFGMIVLLIYLTRFDILSVLPE